MQCLFTSSDTRIAYEFACAALQGDVAVRAAVPDRVIPRLDLFVSLTRIHVGFAIAALHKAAAHADTAASCARNAGISDE